MKKMDNEKKELIKDAVKRLKGYERREYQAQIALDYFQGNARKTEQVMGWGREALNKFKLNRVFRKGSDEIIRQ